MCQQKQREVERLREMVNRLLPFHSLLAFSNFFRMVIWIIEFQNNSTIFLRDCHKLLVPTTNSKLIPRRTAVVNQIDHLELGTFAK